MKQDIIYLQGMRIDTIIGIYAWERRVKQTIVLDMEFAADIGKAAQNDRIEDTLDYKAICKKTIAFVEASSFQLVETLAERIAEMLLQTFNLSWIRLTLSKPGALRQVQNVGVTIERHADNE